MIKKVITIRDTAAEAYFPPQYFNAVGEFLRAFGEAANDPNATIGKHPSDFVGFLLGEFDDSTATFNLLDAPKSLGVASDYVTRGQAG